MKALSLWQPWATLVALGVKRWETRSWPTKYRGLLAIHATLASSAEAKANASESEVVSSALTAAGLGDRLNRRPLPRGAIVGAVRLADVVQVEDTRGFRKRIAAHSPDLEAELELGDFRPGRFAWRLEGPVRFFPEPIRARGSQGLWTLDEELSARYLEVLRASKTATRSAPSMFPGSDFAPGLDPG